jgi:uncharacterized protein YbdZ (MbtH family)
MLKHGILFNDTKNRYEAWRHGTMIGTCSSGCKETTLRIWKERYLKYIEMEWNGMKDAGFILKRIVRGGNRDGL